MTERRPGRMWLAALGCVVGGVGCDVGPASTVALPERAQAAFERDMQPVLGIGCGALDCHGDSGRPMRLYSERGLRLTKELRGEPITAAEIGANMNSVSAISAGPSSLALLKPLALAAGGVDHVGGELWASADTAEFTCVKGWLDGTSETATVRSACGLAVDAAVKLSPP